jgi:hypothetical protein
VPEQQVHGESTVTRENVWKDFFESHLALIRQKEGVAGVREVRNEFRSDSGDLERKAD